MLGWKKVLIRFVLVLAMLRSLRSFACVTMYPYE